jgi:hypothetical protein
MPRSDRPTGARPLARRRAHDEPDGAVREWLLHVEGEPAPAGIVARGVFLLLLALWTVSFVRHGVDPVRLMDSFLHLVNLPFHEAGHVLLIPFGRFVTVLGGSLFQVLVPLVCAAVFLVRHREPYSAAVATWWAGQSLMDLAPYIADARALRLPLIGGRTGAEVEGHDWEYLLQALGLLQQDVLLGRLSFLTGALVMLASLAWAGAVLFRQHAARAR